MGENKTEMDSPPGCSSSEDGISDINELSILATPGDRIQKSEVGTPVLNQSCDADNSVDGHTPKKRRPFPYNKNGLDTDSVPSPHIPVSRLEKKAYRQKCFNRPILTAPSNTGSFICENTEDVDFDHDIEHDFDDDYHSRLNEEFEGEKERTNHEENVSRRHEILKARLDQANRDIERMRPMEEENIKLRQRVVELEGEVMKLRSINRSIKRDRTQSLSEASFET